MVCHLFITKPLSEPEIVWCQIIPWEQSSAKFESNLEISQHWTISLTYIAFVNCQSLMFLPQSIISSRPSDANTCMFHQGGPSIIEITAVSICWLICRHGPQEQIQENDFENVVDNILIWPIFSHFAPTHWTRATWETSLACSTRALSWNKKKKNHILWSHSYVDVIKWKHFPRYWPFARGIYRPLVVPLTKGLWRGALRFSLICAWKKRLHNNRDAGNLRRHRAHYDVTVMWFVVISNEPQTVLTRLWLLCFVLIGMNLNTVRCRYNAVNFRQTHDNRQPIVRPWGRGMECMMLWVWSPICCCHRSAVCNILSSWFSSR